MKQFDSFRERSKRHEVYVEYSSVTAPNTVKLGKTLFFKVIDKSKLFLLSS